MPLVPRQLRPRCRASPPPRVRCRLNCIRIDDAGKIRAGRRRKNFALAFAFAVLILLLLLPVSLFAGGVRLRDLVMIAGARDNQLVGYGLVAGLGRRRRQGPGLHQADRGQSAAALRHQHSGHDALGKKRRGRHGHGGHPAVSQKRRAD